MKEITTSKGTFLFIEVPDDALDDRWFVVYNVEKDSFCVEFQTYGDNIYVDLNTNKDCYVISTTKDISEEQCTEVVDSRWEGIGLVYYKNYLTNYRDSRQWTIKTAKESLQSLILANDLSLETNYLILKKL